MHFGGQQYLITTNLDSYQLKCAQQVLQKPACPFCQVTIPCGCSLKLGTLQAPAPLAQCHNHLINHVVAYSVNWGVVQTLKIPHFDKDIFYDNDTTSTFKLPDFSHSMHRFEDLVHEELQQGLDLHQDVEAKASETPHKFI